MPSDEQVDLNRFGIDSGEDCCCQLDLEKFEDTPCQHHAGQCVETLVEKNRLTRENVRLREENERLVQRLRRWGRLAESIVMAPVLMGDLNTFTAEAMEPADGE